MPTHTIEIQRESLHIQLYPPPPPHTHTIHISTPPLPRFPANTCNSILMGGTTYTAIIFIDKRFRRRQKYSMKAIERISLVAGYCVLVLTFLRREPIHCIQVSRPHWNSSLDLNHLKLPLYAPPFLFFAIKTYQPNSDTSPRNYVCGLIIFFTLL